MKVANYESEAKLEDRMIDQLRKQGYNYVVMDIEFVVNSDGKFKAGASNLKYLSNPEIIDIKNTNEIITLFFNFLLISIFSFT